MVLKKLYIYLFSPKHLNCPLNFSAGFFIIKRQSYVERLWNTIGISFGVIYDGFKTLWAAPLYFPV